MTNTEHSNPYLGGVTHFHYTDADTGVTYSGIIEEIDGEKHVVYLDDGEFNEDVEDNGEAGKEED